MNCIYIIFLLIILFLLMNIYENIDFCNINTCKSDFILKDNICVGNTYNFTNCGATGRLGPTLEYCKTSYYNTNLKNNITMTDDRSGIQIWTVPQTGKYLITVAGAGIKINNTDKKYDYSGGTVINSEFILTKDDILKILVGQKGIKSYSTPEHFENYSGSGGSFVVKCNNKICDNSIENNIPLIIAGGAGGVNFNKIANYDKSILSLSNASYTTEGNSETGDIVIDGGGKDGNGGSYSTIYYDKNKDQDVFKRYYFGFGGGFKTDGKAIYNGNITTIYYCGKSFLNGGLGGVLPPNPKDINEGEGGFGGGSSSLYNLSGNGGGYSGGASNHYIGCGGGSYSINIMNKIGYNNDHGYVNIKYLG